jgi:hypothetical protein
VAHDVLLSDLAKAIALELLQAGYRPRAIRGYAQQAGEPARLVSEEVWRAMNEIVAGDARAGRETRDT